MLDADAERRIRGDGGRDDRVLDDLAIEELEGLAHCEIVAGTATDQRHGCAHDAVCASNDFLLIAGETVSQQEQDLVFTGTLVLRAGGCGRARTAQVSRSVSGRVGRDREAAATECGHHDAVVARPVGRDLPRCGAADERYGRRNRAHAFDHRREILRGRSEDDQQPGVGAADRG